MKEETKHKKTYFVRRDEVMWVILFLMRTKSYKIACNVHFQSINPTRVAAFSINLISNLLLAHLVK